MGGAYGAGGFNPGMPGRQIYVSNVSHISPSRLLRFSQTPVLTKSLHSCLTTWAGKT